MTHRKGFEDQSRDQGRVGQGDRYGGATVGGHFLTEALAEAAKAGLDLVEVSPTAAPPVCRIMDYGKFRYQQSKKVQVSKKKPDRHPGEGDPPEAQDGGA